MMNNTTHLLTQTTPSQIQYINWQTAVTGLRKPVAILFRKNPQEYLKSLGILSSDYEDLPYKVIYADSFRQVTTALNYSPELIVVGGVMVNGPGSLITLKTCSTTIKQCFCA